MRPAVHLPGVRHIKVIFSRTAAAVLDVNTTTSQKFAVSGPEAGSCLRLIDLVHHSTLGLRVRKKKKEEPGHKIPKSTGSLCPRASSFFFITLKPRVLCNKEERRRARTQVTSYFGIQYIWREGYRAVAAIVSVPCQEHHRRDRNLRIAPTRVSIGLHGPEFVSMGLQTIPDPLRPF